VALGLPAEATEADVEAALGKATVTAAVAEAAEGAAPAAPAAAPAAPAAAPAPAPAAAPAAPVALSGGPETVVLSAAVWAETEAQLKTLSEEAAIRRRKETLDVALSAGRISPAEIKTWATALETNEAGTVTLLSSLPARYSTVEVGLSDGGSTLTDEAELEKLADEAGI
jgi:hypothetical protein